jgi:hypothetical protein
LGSASRSLALGLRGGFGASDLMQSCCVVTMPPCFNHVARRSVFGDVVVIVVVVVSSVMYCDALYIDFQVFIESMYICLFELACARARENA